MTILIYVALIATANIITAATTPLDLGPLGFVTWGTFFAGATFFARDAVQVQYSRKVAYACIGTGLVISAVVSAVTGDTLAIVTASLCAFAVSESADTEVFTRTPWQMPGRVLASGVVGSILDSAVFVVVGLSPLWSGFIPWSAVPRAIFGQVVIKCALQLAAAAAVLAWRRREVIPT